MSEKTERYAREMGLIRQRLSIITPDSDPEQLALDQPRLEAYGRCWDACYKLEEESEKDRRRLEAELQSFDNELTNRRNLIDTMAERVKTADASPEHLRGAKAQWAFALQDILRRQPEDFA